MIIEFGTYGSRTVYRGLDLLVLETFEESADLVMPAGELLANLFAVQQRLALEVFERRRSQHKRIRLVLNPENADAHRSFPVEQLVGVG